MPKLSDDTLLQRAIAPALRDRASFVEANYGVGEWAEEARALMVKIRALRGRRLSSLSDADLETAEMCFVYAEQWELSLAEANAPTGKVGIDASLRNARLFHDARTRMFGKTVLENKMESATIWQP